jgi:5-methylthioadenosine/S-adenosylhomocysteine deaminase
MPFVPTDLCIEARWIAPMAAQNQLLENHSLMIRDGRILDILPSVVARERYSATVVMQRFSHLLIPGMINAHAEAALLLFRGAATETRANRFVNAEFAHDSTLVAIAEMLKSGITCFSDSYYFPEETALAASAQGMRAVVGMPVAETPTPWAKTASQSLTQSLNLRDKYLGHPLISTAFAPHSLNTLSDETFSRLATLADELDAGIMIDLHQSVGEIRESTARFNMRPIERLGKLGLLSPALNAVHMVQVTHADIDLAQRSGISIILCPESNLNSGDAAAPVSLFAAAGIRLSLGSAGSRSRNQDIWGAMKLLALMSHAGSGDARLSAWDALRIANHGGAEVLGLENEVGTLQAGKWADLCCVDLSGPGIQPVSDAFTQLVFSGGRDIVSDVWVAGRQLLSGGELTRLDWSAVAARSAAWAARMTTGG